MLFLSFCCIKNDIRKNLKLYQIPYKLTLPGKSEDLVSLNEKKKIAEAHFTYCHFSESFFSIKIIRVLFACIYFCLNSTSLFYFAKYFNCATFHLCPKQNHNLNVKIAYIYMND